MGTRLVRRGAPRVLALGICLCAVAACGSTSTTSSAPTSAATPTSTATTPTATTPTAATTLAVSVKELGGSRVAFTVPASVSGGLVNVEFTNSGTKLNHFAQFIRLDSGHTIREAFKVLPGNTSPLWLHGIGGVGETAPGATNTAQMVLPAGTYYIVDTGKMTSQGFGKLQVQGSGAANALPSTAATITAQEIAPMKSAYKISGLKAGDNAVTFDNPAANTQLHHFSMIELRPGATLAAVKKFLSSQGRSSGPPPSGPPPFAGRPPGPGGLNAAVLDPGRSEIANVKLKAGSSYAVLCFISDRDGGPPHFTEGMIAKVDIK